MNDRDLWNAASTYREAELKLGEANDTTATLEYSLKEAVEARIFALRSWESARTALLDATR